MSNDFLPSAESIGKARNSEREQIIALLGEFAARVRELRMNTEWSAYDMVPCHDDADRLQLAASNAFGQYVLLRELKFIPSDPPCWHYSYDVLTDVGPYGPYQDFVRSQKTLEQSIESFPGLDFLYPDELRPHLHRLLVKGGS